MSKNAAPLAIPFRPSAQAVAKFDWEQWGPAIEALSQGLSFAKACQIVGGSPAALYRAVRESPQLYDQIRRHREAIRELAQLRAMGEFHNRLDRPKEMSTRDLTDLVRATKQGDGSGGTQVTVNIDLPI